MGSMWGKVDVTVPAEMQTKKPVSVTYADKYLGLNVLFDDGSIWWKPGQTYLKTFLHGIRQWDRPQNKGLKNAVDRMTAGTFPFESVNAWFQFSRLSSGIGNYANWMPFAWDDNQDFYQFLGQTY